MSTINTNEVEETEQPSTTIIYGALAKPHVEISGTTKIKRRLKRQLFEIKDQLFLLAGNTKYIDYRNYDNEFSSNIGDIAISETITQLINERSPLTKFSYKNWGTLNHCKGNEKTKIIVAGGGYFFIDKNGNLPLRLIDDLEFIKRTNSEIFLFGVGLNQPEHDYFSETSYSPTQESTEAISELINRASAISVRDKTTNNFIKRYTSKEVQIIGDPALHLKPEPAQLAYGNRPVIGINLPFHGPSTTRLLKRNLLEYISLLKNLQKATNCEYKYFIHYDSEHFIARLISLNGIRLCTVKSPPQQMISQYQQLDLHIGGMLHSCILAHAAGTPCISLGYDIKHFGFYELLDLKDNLFSWIELEPNKILGRAIELINDPSDTIKKIALSKAGLRGELNSFLDNLVSNLCRSTI